MKNIKKLLNTNIIENQIKSSFFFTLKTGLQTKKSKNGISIGQHIVKNSSYFKQIESLHLKFPLQLIIFKDRETFNEYATDSSNAAILFKSNNFLFIDKNFFLLKSFNEKYCSNKLASCLQEAVYGVKSLLGEAKSDAL
jgi:hypothetical protein